MSSKRSWRKTYFGYCCGFLIKTIPFLYSALLFSLKSQWELMIWIRGPAISAHSRHRVGQEDPHFLRIFIYIQSHPKYLRHCDHLCFTLQNPLYLLCLRCLLSHSLLMGGEHFCPNSVGFPVLSLIIDMSLDSTVFPGPALPWLGVQNPPIRDMQIVHLHTM